MYLFVYFFVSAASSVFLDLASHVPDPRRTGRSETTHAARGPPGQGSSLQRGILQHRRGQKRADRVRGQDGVMKSIITLRVKVKEI